MARSGQKQIDLRAKARGLVGRDPVGLDLGFAAQSPSPGVQLRVRDLLEKLRQDWSPQPVDETVDTLRRYSEALTKAPRPPALAELTGALTDRLLTDTDSEVIDGAARRMLCALKLEPAASRMIVQQPGNDRMLHLRSPTTDHRTCCGMKIGPTWVQACPRGIFLTGEENRRDGISRSVACKTCSQRGSMLGIEAARESPRFDPFHDDERDVLYDELADMTARLVASLPEDETRRRQTNLSELAGLSFLDKFGRLIVYRRLCDRPQHANDRLLRELYLAREPGVLELVERAYGGEVPPVSPETWLAAYDSACSSYLQGRPPARIWPGSSERFNEKRLRQSIVSYLMVHAFPEAFALASAGEQAEDALAQTG